MAKLVAGKHFLQWLEDVRIVPKGTSARRVVIDAEANSVIRVYVELYGTEEMIRVTPPAALEGAKVEILGP